MKIGRIIKNILSFRHIELKTDIILQNLTRIRSYTYISIRVVSKLYNF